MIEERALLREVKTLGIAQMEEVAQAVREMLL
jgi:hypothetical protein